MCFDKRSLKRKVAKKSIYVVKYGDYANDEYFEPQYQYPSFIYRVGVLAKKGIRDKIKAFFNSELNGEVFHAYNVLESKNIASGNLLLKNNGLFEIPKGTVYYENTSDREIATFAICYLGPLTEDNKHVVLKQSIELNGTT